jgi:hypothetical protein
MTKPLQPQTIETLIQEALAIEAWECMLTCENFAQVARTTARRLVVILTTTSVLIPT